MNWILKKLLGSKNERDLKKLQPLVARINELDEEYKALTDEQLKAKTIEFRERLKNGETLEDIEMEAFAVVKNTSRRLCGTQVEVCGHPTDWEMVHFDVQLIGGLAMHKGMIAEMATGEGKTLVATLPVYLNALSGNGAHVVTTSDYHSKRDSEWMGHVYKWLGLTVGCLENMMPPPQRREMYLRDITYGTNSEFGFDYLRDNMAFRSEDMVQQKGHNFAIVDEIDSILIDEARTPLIISGPAPYSSTQYSELQPAVARLVRRQNDFCSRLLKEAKEQLETGEEDEAALKMYQVFEGMPKNKQLMHLIEDVKIRKLLEKTQMSMLSDMRKELARDLQQELFFTIDEKGHDAGLTEKGCTELNPNDPEMYVLPDMVTAMAELDGDTSLSPEELMEKRRAIQEEFAIRNERVHAVDQLIRAYSVYEKDVDYVVQDNQVVIVDENTGRLMAGRRWSDGLHQSVEAKEGVKIERETQTLATITIQNYFRMYKKLSGMTGTAETEADEFHQIYKLDVMVIPTNRPVRRVDLNDQIYKTQREKFKAVLDEVRELVDRVGGGSPDPANLERVAASIRHHWATRQRLAVHAKGRCIDHRCASDTFAPRHGDTSSVRSRHRGHRFSLVTRGNEEIPPLERHHGGGGRSPCSEYENGTDTRTCHVHGKSDTGNVGVGAGQQSVGGRDDIDGTGPLGNVGAHIDREVRVRLMRHCHAHTVKVTRTEAILDLSEITGSCRKKDERRVDSCSRKACRVYDWRARVHHRIADDPKYHGSTPDAFAILTFSWCWSYVTAKAWDPSGDART